MVGGGDGGGVGGDGGRDGGKAGGGDGSGHPPGDVLVLDGLNEGELGDGPVPHGPHHAHEGEVAQQPWVGGSD